MLVGSRTDASREYVFAHRLAWEMANGPIPNGLFVCHKCDVPSCVNAEHLFVGTHADNMSDAVSKNRMHNTFQSAKTHCPQGHEFSPENTRKTTTGQRACKKCQRASSRSLYIRQRPNCLPRGVYKLYCKRGHPLFGSNHNIDKYGHRTCKICVALTLRMRTRNDRY